MPNYLAMRTAIAIRAYLFPGPGHKLSHNGLVQLTTMIEREIRLGVYSASINSNRISLIELRDELRTALKGA